MSELGGTLPYERSENRYRVVKWHLWKQQSPRQKLFRSIGLYFQFPSQDFLLFRIINLLKCWLLWNTKIPKKLIRPTKIGQIDHLTGHLTDQNCFSLSVELCSHLADLPLFTFSVEIFSHLALRFFSHLADLSFFTFSVLSHLAVIGFFTFSSFLI